jgi:peptidoglycan/xylan/chitin deacetylase (PgdA/CDA1 family)
MKHPTVFLMYHELEVAGACLCQSDPGYLRYVLKSSDFEAQMQFLKTSGWRGCSVGDVLGSTAKGGVAITFDDGSETDLLYAAPLLRELQFGATFYITTGFLGRRGNLSKGQLRKLSDLGFEIGSHSMTHAYLTELNQTSLDRELLDSKAQLEDIVGKRVEHLSCPGGRFDRRTIEAARRIGYRSLTTSRAHTNSASTNHFSLGRVPIRRGTGLDTFAAFCRGRGLRRMAFQDTLRSAARIALGNSSYDRVRAALMSRGGRGGE